MSRAYTFAAITVVVILASALHFAVVTSVGPGTAAYESADGSSIGDLDGGEWAANFYEILAVWVPWIGIGGSFGWGLVREYRRQRNTSVVSSAGRRGPLR